MTPQKLFRLFHGPGDTGSEMEYNCQNSLVIKGWERLARKFTKMEESLKSSKAAVKRLGEYFDDHP